MARGDPLLSPWLWAAGDYVGRQITISVAFNNSTRAIQSATVHRDDGCQYHTIVFDVPSDQVKAKRLAAPTDGAGDKTYTKAQINAQGLTVIEDILAIQITAEP